MRRVFLVSVCLAGLLGVFLCVTFVGGVGRGYTPEDMARVDQAWRAVESLVDERDAQWIQAVLERPSEACGPTQVADAGRLGGILTDYKSARRLEPLVDELSLCPGSDAHSSVVVWVAPDTLQPGTLEVLDDFTRWLSGAPLVEETLAANVSTLLELTNLTLAVHGKDPQVVAGVLELAHSLRAHGALTHTRVGLAISEHALRRSVRADLPLGDAFERFAPSESELAPVLAREAVFSAMAVELAVEEGLPQPLRGMTREFAGVVARDLLAERMDRALTADAVDRLSDQEPLGPVALGLGVALSRPEACKALLAQHTFLAFDGLGGHVQEYRRAIREFEGALASREG